MLAAAAAVTVALAAAYYPPVKPAGYGGDGGFLGAVGRQESTLGTPNWRCAFAYFAANSLIPFGFWVLPIRCWNSNAFRSAEMVRKVTYRPPGTEHNLLNEVNLSLREKSFGLIFGRSGSGKTTLLQLLAGLSEPTSGSICIQKYDDSGNPIGLPEILTSQRVGIVFQFPERYFLADTVLEEVTFGWPRQKADLLFKEQLALNLQNAFNSVGLTTISLDEDPQSLSGGFKRRLSLALQLVQTPDLLLLDEPLAGLVDVVAKFLLQMSDWKARADVVNLLKELKKHHTILVVSHDLR
ncbi:ABC transporter I family member 11, chloroplastic [Dichanthelium oligosanthes]|uniref:ABC transporter I family member 11, chloroplastic n=1 Tax=Dichanthelium oligosanthes TaxID=888268 RepID=A0A1E5VQ27_9POAL|nr:ABC transporter I family member 11, chloroplastic [Dichanthelium oligosanthes]